MENNYQFSTEAEDMHAGADMDTEAADTVQGYLENVRMLESRTNLRNLVREDTLREIDADFARNPFGWDSVIA